MADKSVDELDDDIDTPDLVVQDGDLDIDVDPKAEDLLTVVDEEGESWSDDPVRMYLTQMGEIPLLTRQQEIALAKRIEITRARFRRRLLECDYVIQLAVKVLQARSRRRIAVRPHGAGLGDRPLGKRPDSRAGFRTICGRSTPCSSRTRTITASPRSKCYKMAQRRDAWRRLGRRRRRAVKLVEELGLRTQRIEPLIKTLEEFSRRVDELKAQIDALQDGQEPAGRSQEVDHRVPQHPAGQSRKRPPACATASAI